MSFDPFESKEARAMVAKVCKDKSLAGLCKVFDTANKAKSEPPNHHLGGINGQLGDQCLAMAEIVAVGRGNGSRNVEFPKDAAAWLEKAPAFDDELAKAAKEAVDKVRTYSEAWAIAEDMGGWPEWTNYCRGLSTRLGKPAKPRKAARTADSNELLDFFKANECRLILESGQPVELRVTETGQLTDADLERVIQLKKLRAMQLSGQKITDDGLPMLSALKQLADLSLRETDIKGPGFRNLKLPRLKRLQFGPKGVNVVLDNCQHLSGLREFACNSTDITDQGLRKLAGFERLEKFVISDCDKLKGDGLESLQSLKKLKSIIASEIKLTSAGFAALCGLKSLRELGLHYGKFPLKQLSDLSQLKRLESLNLSGIKATDEQFEFLGNLRRLKSLTLKSNPDLTDRTLELIATLPLIEELALTNCGLTKAAEKILEKMTNLRSLDISQTGVSRAAQKRLDSQIESRTG